jgi:hypothetical protein
MIESKLHETITTTMSGDYVRREPMKISTTAVAAAATIATAGALGIAGAATASADTALADDYPVVIPFDNYPVAQPFGTELTLVDADGHIVQGWTIDDVRQSTDVVPWPVQGTLWESTATIKAIRGTVTPAVSNFNARATNGENYQVLALVATAEGVDPSTLGEGGESTGKLYFDVIGQEPNSVVYNAGGRDLLFWVK